MWRVTDHIIVPRNRRDTLDRIVQSFLAYWIKSAKSRVSQERPVVLWNFYAFPFFFFTSDIKKEKACGDKWSRYTRTVSLPPSLWVSCRVPHVKCSFCTHKTYWLSPLFPTSPCICLLLKYSLNDKTPNEAWGNHRREIKFSRIPRCWIPVLQKM